MFYVLLMSISCLYRPLNFDVPVFNPWYCLFYLLSFPWWPYLVSRLMISKLLLPTCPLNSRFLSNCLPHIFTWMLIDFSDTPTHIWIRIFLAPTFQQPFSSQLWSIHPYYFGQSLGVILDSSLAHQIQSILFVLPLKWSAIQSPLISTTAIIWGIMIPLSRNRSPYFYRSPYF